MKNPAKAKMGKATTMDAKENKIIHVQRLKLVKLYNNPMDETKAAGKPDYPQKLKVPEGYEKINDLKYI